MLKPEDNALLTLVTGDAPMGAWMRQNFWIPAALSEKLESNEAPLRVKLFGERFIAFRTVDGHVGFFDEACPHRGASLALARQEDNALRCLFHGWKFHVKGEVLEVPTQTNDANAFCKTVPLKHYPAREGGGIVWVWLGQGRHAPRLPEFEFMTLPSNRFVTYKQVANFNWLQGVETTLDSAHVGFLHRSHIAGMGHIAHAAKELAPVYEVEEQAYGFRYAGLRNLNTTSRYVRVNSFVYPWFGVIAPRDDYQGGAVFFTVPIDDENSTYWTVRYRMDQAIERDAVTLFSDPADWPPKVPGAAKDNWGQDRDLMRNGHFSGFPQHITTEDLVICESQGGIVDRSKEFLNTGDIAIVRLRRILLREVRSFMARQKEKELAPTPKGQILDACPDRVMPDALAHQAQSPYDHIEYGAIRSKAGLLPIEQDWRSL